MTQYLLNSIVAAHDCVRHRRAALHAALLKTVDRRAQHLGASQPEAAQHRAAAWQEMDGCLNGAQQPPLGVEGTVNACPVPEQQDRFRLQCSAFCWSLAAAILHSRQSWLSNAHTSSKKFRHSADHYRRCSCCQRGTTDTAAHCPVSLHGCTLARCAGQASS